MKKQNLIFFISILLFITLLHSNARDPNTSENAFALVNGKLIDGTGASPLLDAVLIVKGNPMEDLEALQRLRLVIHNGEIIREAK